MAAVGPVGNCQALQVVIGSCFAAAVSLTSLLFFFRVRAILYTNKWIVAIFSLLWLGTVAGSATVPFAITGSHIGPTDYCVNTGVKPYSSTGIIIVAANDTLVFFAISWKLLSSPAIDESIKAKAKVFISGNGLPAITRSLLQSGQEYYLYGFHFFLSSFLDAHMPTNSITVAANILTMAMILAPSLPAVLHAMFTVPNVAIVNSLACRVFRDIKFGRISSHTIIPMHSSTLTSHPFPAAHNSRRIPRDSYEMEVEVESTQDIVEASKPYGTHMSKAVHQPQDPPMTITFQ